MPLSLLLYYFCTATIAMDIPSNTPLAPSGVFAEEQKHLIRGNRLMGGTGVTQETCMVDLTQ